VPVHFLDLASAVEKLRWAEKEWRELDEAFADDEEAEAEHDPAPDQPLVEVGPAPGSAG
jgi:hypothetical protein